MNYSRSTLFPLLAFGLLTVAGPGSAQEWTRFRGPNGTGVGHAPSVPSTWQEQDFNWKIQLAGSGHASPIVWQDSIYVVSSPDNQGGVILQCLSSRDGSEKWRRDFTFPPHRLHQFNNFASSSPAVDKDGVYFYWATPQRVTLMALTHDGRTVWEHDLGAFESQHGGGTSPMVHDGKVYVGNEQIGASYIAAYEAATGKEVWKQNRRSTRAAYSTPCVYESPQGQTQIIFNSQSHGIYAVHPDTGEVLWEYGNAFDKRSVSSPLEVAGVIIGSCGSGGGGNYVVGVRPPTPANPQPELAFKINRSSISPYVPTTVAVGDLLFLWSDSGWATCVQAPTGEIKWQERVPGDYFASPIVIDNRIVNISTAGEVVVLEAADEFRILGVTDLNELCHATPAVAHGKLFVRTARHLYSVGNPSAGETSESDQSAPASL